MIIKKWLDFFSIFGLQTFADAYRIQAFLVFSSQVYNSENLGLKTINIMFYDVNPIQSSYLFLVHDLLIFLQDFQVCLYYEKEREKTRKFKWFRMLGGSRFRQILIEEKGGGLLVFFLSILSSSSSPSPRGIESQALQILASCPISRNKRLRTAALPESTKYSALRSRAARWPALSWMKQQEVAISLSRIPPQPISIKSPSIG